MSNKEHSDVLSIDFGTSNSCAFAGDTHVPMGYSQPLLQSVVAIEEGSWSVPKQGQLPHASVFYLVRPKRLLGRPAEDGSLPNDVDTTPHAAIGKAGAYYDVGGPVSPVEVIGFLIGKIRQTASMKLNRDFKTALIAVPAYFTSSQKYATEVAARTAGFDHVRLIEEPVAAAIDHTNFSNVNDGEYKLVIDVGDGTSDVSLVYCEDMNFVVKATSGHNNMAGSDVTKWMADAAIEKCSGDRSRIDMAGLLAECEVQKAEMAEPSHEQIQIVVQTTTDTVTARQYVTFTRADFNDICEPLWTEVIRLCDEVLEMASRSWVDLSAVVLTGGTCSLPRIRELCEQRCQVAKPPTLEGEQHLQTIQVVNLEPEYSVARGMGLLVAHPDITIVPVVPRSIGLEVDRQMTGQVGVDILIPRNTTLPCQKTKEFITKEGQKEIELTIVEGEEEEDYARNTLLGEITISGLTGAVQTIEVKIEISKPGDITVVARARGKKHNLPVTTKRPVQDAEIEELRERTLARLKGFPVGKAPEVNDGPDGHTRDEQNLDGYSGGIDNADQRDRTQDQESSTAIREYHAGEEPAGHGDSAESGNQGEDRVHRECVVAARECSEEGINKEQKRKKRTGQAGTGHAKKQKTGSRVTK